MTRPVVPTRIVVETLIDAPQSLCFDMTLDVAAHRESAAFSGETMVPPGKLEGRLGLGDLIAFEGRHFGMRQRFVARITRVERPHLFVDEMVEGTFRWLRHDHEFHERGPSSTLMRDVLEWESPLGVVGRLADRLFVARHMRWFVATKQANLARIIEMSSRA